MKRPTILLRFISRRLLPGLVIAAGVLALGCTEMVLEDESGDAGAYALDIKTQVTQLMNQAKASPKATKSCAQGVIEAMEDYRSQPVGRHRQIYADLLAGGQELKQMCEQSADAAKINAKVEELLALAGKLPGEVVLEE